MTEPLRYDTALRFDSGHRFDSSAPPPVIVIPGRKSKRIMNIIKLELRLKTIDQKIPLGQNHITSMTGNTNYPVATRQPTDAQFQTAQDDLVAANNAVAAAETAWKAAIQARNDKEAAWDAAVTARAANCEAVTPGDRAALQTTGFPLRSAPTPVGLVAAPATSAPKWANSAAPSNSPGTASTAPTATSSSAKSTTPPIPGPKSKSSASPASPPPPSPPAKPTPFTSAP